MKKVSVVILNWNGKRWLETFLPSVLKTSYALTEIIVIDNNSSDDSVDFLKSKYRQVKIFIWDKNYGFTEGYNRIIPHLDAPYFVLLNSDVEVTPNWLNPLVSLMENDSSIIAVQPKILSYHQKDFFEYAGASGGFLDTYAYPFCRGRIFDSLEEDHGQYDKPIEVFWASGACSILRTEYVKEIGLFEPRFFAHMEEIDFCWRARNHGYKIMCEPKSVVYHVGGGTLPQSSPRKTYLNVRNSLAMMYTNLPINQLYTKMFIRLILDGVWGGRLMLQGKWKVIVAIIRGHWAFFRQISYWQKRRGRIYNYDNPKSMLTGKINKSIVWEHFAKGKNTWKEIYPNS